MIRILQWSQSLHDLPSKSVFGRWPPSPPCPNTTFNTLFNTLAVAHHFVDSAQEANAQLQQEVRQARKEAAAASARAKSAGLPSPAGPLSPQAASAARLQAQLEVRCRLGTLTGALCWVRLGRVPCSAPLCCTVLSAVLGWARCYAVLSTCCARLG